MELYRAHLNLDLLCSLMSMLRTAVDSTAENYWKTYFGEYGSAWVRQIPTRTPKKVASAVAQALGNSIRRADASSAQVHVRSMRPLSAPFRTTAGLVFEFEADTSAGRRMGCATLSPEDGRIVALDSVAA